MDNDDKMAYLVQTMVTDSPADRLVKSFPPCGENYTQAIEQLKSRYARDELLIEIYVRELLSLVLQQAKDSQTIKLASLYDKLKTQLRALEVLGVTSEKYAAMLYPLVESALPTEILRVWERQRSRDRESDPLKGLLNFMKMEVESEERIQITRQNLNAEEQPKIPTAACLVAGDAKPSKSNSKASKPSRLCIWCDKDSHSSHECFKAQKMTLEERQDVVAKKKACILCFRKHTNKCRADTKCLICQSRHAMLMCPELAKPKKVEDTHNVLTSKTNGTTLLQTLLVKINGKTVRAFIDSGAQRSYLKKDIAEKLNLKLEGEETLKHCLFGGLETREESHKVYQINVKNTKEDTCLTMMVLSKEKICGYIPRVQNDAAIMRKIKNHKLTFTDVGENTPEVGLLIGADYAGRIATDKVLHITEDIHAFKTKLGWTLQGKVARENSLIIASADICEDDIGKLWDLETLGIEDPKDTLLKNKSNKEAMENFKENINVNEEQRYEVRLPWKIDRPELLENKKLAEQRLKSTTKKLKAMNELQNYGKVFEEWLELGIIEVDSDVTIPGHYLAHHAVIKESSLTTRVRPVFDASARDVNGNSINTCLEKGQNFLELIPTLLTKFRMNTIGVTSDIKKAFLQISIAKEDRKYLRFLWWNDKEEILVYRHCREITETTRREDWRHISGRLNPADLPSRGCSAKKLVESKWWESPDWLKESEDKWPINVEFTENNEEVVKKLRKTKIVSSNTETVTENFTTVLNNISKYTRIVRTLTWILRFYYNCRNNDKMKGEISFEEVNLAEKLLYKVMQEESFQSKVNLRGMKNLEIINDKDGIMRVKTRLTLSEENENFKFPILLYGKHPIVVKMVEQKHKQYLHAGINVLTSILRNDFWILRGKKLVKNVSTKCITCKRFKAKSYETATAPLPKNRVKDAAVFQVTGVDAAGPLILDTRDKCWIILFTCAVYRAVHLELVMSMSTECFLMALRRFIARRGRVHTMYSDNGTNFIGAENLLSSVDWDAVQCYSTIHKIKWIFNPPAAPWWGGWWERLIQMVKQLLRRNLGNSILTYIELETVLCDIESVINSRPLTYVTEDDTLQPLTPASFLQTLSGATEVADIDEVDAQSLNARQKFIQKLRNDLRQRFRNEYLSLLVSRSQKSNRAIQEGDVVLVETEAKRSTWPLGLVIEIHPGTDDHIRVAKVKTTDGFRVRPVQRLYPLEIHDDVQPNRRNEGPAVPVKTKSGRQVKMPRRLDL